MQEKAIAYRTDSYLRKQGRATLVQTAQAQGFALRQSYQRIGPKLQPQAAATPMPGSLDGRGVCSRSGGPLQAASYETLSGNWH